MGSKAQTLLRPLPRPSLLRDVFNGTSIRAAQFTAANSERLSCADASFPTTGDVDWVFSCWFYSDSNGDHNLLGKGTAGQYEFQAYRKNADGKLRTEILDAAGSSIGTVDSAALVSNSAWHHLVFYHDSVGNLVGQALDGAAYRTAATSGSPVDGTAAFTIGALNTASQFWDGRITRACWFKTPTGVAALADTIRDTLYNNGTPLNFSDLTSAEKTAWGLVAGSGEWWQLDEVSTGAATTRVGSVNAVNLTDNNTVTTKAFSLATNGINRALATLQDTKNQLFTAAGFLQNGGSVDGAWGNPRAVYGPYARKAGRTLELAYSGEGVTATDNFILGWSNTATPTDSTTIDAGVAPGNLARVYAATATISNLSFTTTTAGGQTRQYRIIALATGYLIYVRGFGCPTGYTSATGPWALLWHEGTLTSASLWAVLTDRGDVVSQVALDQIRVYDRAAPTPIVSDTFTRGNTTGPLGSAESGQAWSTYGTSVWGITSNKAYQSTANAGLHRAVVDAGVADGVLECTVVRGAAGAVGLSFRVSDVNNGWRFDSDGATGRVRKIVAGVESTVASAATATGLMRVVMVGSSIQCYVGNTRILNITDAFNATATQHGLAGESTDTATTWDDFYVWAGLAS